MLSNSDQETGDNKKLAVLAVASGGFLLLIMLVALAGNTAGAASMDQIKRLTGSMAGALPQPALAALSDQARIMGLPMTDGSQAYWYLARAGGMVAYVLLWLATCWGIMMSSKFTKGFVEVTEAFALHEFLPILGVLFAAIHALALLGDSFIGFSLGQLLVPFTSTYEPFWTGIGSLAFYLFLALILSFYVRKRIGQKNWRALHYASYLAFVLALLHGLMAGSDSGAPSMRLFYLATGGIALFLLFYRMLSYTPRKVRARAAAAPEPQRTNLP